MRGPRAKGSSTTLCRPATLPAGIVRSGVPGWLAGRPHTGQVARDIGESRAVELGVLAHQRRSVTEVERLVPQPGRQRPRSRQLVLGDNLDTEHIQASYDSGVLTLQIPVAEHAKPRKIEISSKNQGRQAINA